MPSCIVKGCSVMSRKLSRKVILHAFPADKDRIKLWLQQTGKDFEDIDNFTQMVFDAKANDIYRMCSLHFTENSYKPYGPHKYLRKDAIPTLFESASSTKGPSIRAPTKRKRTQLVRDCEDTTAFKVDGPLLQMPATCILTTDDMPVTSAIIQPSLSLAISQGDLEIAKQINPASLYVFENAITPCTEGSSVPGPSGEIKLVDPPDGGRNEVAEALLQVPVASMLTKSVIDIMSISSEPTQPTIQSEMSLVGYSTVNQHNPTSLLMLPHRSACSQKNVLMFRNRVSTGVATEFFVGMKHAGVSPDYRIGRRHVETQARIKTKMKAIQCNLHILTPVNSKHGSMKSNASTQTEEEYNPTSMRTSPSFESRQSRQHEQAYPLHLLTIRQAFWHLAYNKHSFLKVLQKNNHINRGHPACPCISIQRRGSCKEQTPFIE